MKHAYLIIAHDNFENLYYLIKALDFEKNDIYVHIDKKAVGYNKCVNKIKLEMKKARLFFVENRISVFWGGDTQIKCELNLLNYAVLHGKYDYYHLLSGVDFPIKTNEYIYKYFEDNNGIEYVHFDSDKANEYPDKYEYFYFFQNTNRIILKKINYKLVGLQKKFHFKRKHPDYFKGSNWFSITDELAKYILKNKKKIRIQYKFTWCCDEVFLQTLIMNSKFKIKLSPSAFENNSESCLRYIDWNRGTPYVFKSDDFDSLIDSDCLFARKISNANNCELSKKLLCFLKNQKQ